MRLYFLPFTSTTLLQLPSKLLRLASRVRLSRLQGVTRLQQRSLSRAALQAQLVQHYIKQGDSAEESHDLATAELRWLAQAAREQASSAKAEEERLTSMVRDLVEEDKPLAYILGSQPFHPLPIPLLVRPPTLIPRPETEHWVSHLTSLLSAFSSSPRPFTLLDIGTGTGCIPLALAAGLPSAKAVAVDREASAVDLARENVELCKEVVGDRVKIVQADLFLDDFAESVRNHTPVATGFDLVVSNPPYIPVGDYAGLAQSVRGWEDRGALVGERRGGAVIEESEVDDGLLFYRRITDILDDLLVEEKQTRFPVMAFEVGAGQVPAVEELLRAKGLRAVSEKDQWGIGRLVLGYRM